MKLRERQSVFLLNAAKLIIWAFDNGYELTGGELLRTFDQQVLYFTGNKIVLKDDGNIQLESVQKKSKTLQSSHLKKLAIDLNLFIDGVYQTDKEAYKPLAEYWKSLHPDNIAGYDWDWDANHFEMK